MRGLDERSGSLFSSIDLEARVRGDHPLRAMLLQAFYGIRSERQLMERLAAKTPPKGEPFRDDPLAS